MLLITLQNETDTGKTFTNQYVVHFSEEKKG